MQLFDKLFHKKPIKQASKNQHQLFIYTDEECKSQFEVQNQTVESFLSDKQDEPNQFMYVKVKHKKTGELLLKKKLYEFEFFADVMEKWNNDQTEGFIVVGYSSERNTIPKINSMMAISETAKFIRSGTLLKFSDTKNIFEDCQLRLHHDYLTYYDLKIKERKVSFMPLENASVEMINEKKHIFTVKDKFKNLMFKTNSKEDMIGWLLAINEAIRIRNAQIYMNELDEKLHKKIKDKLTFYTNRCMNIKEPHKTMLLDEMGRKALRVYFKKFSQEEGIKDDAKVLSIIETYLYMCRVRRQKGQADSQPIIANIRESIIQVREKLPDSIKNKDLASKQQLVKAIEEMMRYLDKKYKKTLIEKKIFHSIFQNHMLDEYKAHSRFVLNNFQS